MISERAHAECVRLLDLLINKRVQESWSWVFMTPVTNIPGYEKIIKKPMDLGTVKKHLGSKPSRCRFKSHEKFARDVRLVFNNAMVYNKDDQHVKGSVFDAAQHLLRVFETAYAKAIDTCFKEEDEKHANDDQEHDATSTTALTLSGGGSSGTNSEDQEHTNADRKTDASVGGTKAEPAASSSSSSSRHRHSESGATGGEEASSSKHKKDKSSKKDKKSKKSKKKSKDKEKKHSSSSGESKKKSHKSSSKDKERDKEKMKDRHGSGGDAAVGSSKSAVGESESSSISSSKKSGSGSSSSASAKIGSGSIESATVKAPSSSSSASSSKEHQGSSTHPTSSSSRKTESTASVPVSASSSSTSSGKMSDTEIQSCLGILMKLIKYKEGSISPAAPFLQPVELSHFPDYRVKVPNRMHLYGVQKKLRSGGYADLNAFAHDVRLVFSNCLIYNSDVILSKVMRSHAVTLMKLFETQFEKIGGTWPGIPERWKCHQILHEILATRTDGQETAQWFKYPIQTYFDSPDQIPYGYYKKIKMPMDIGTVSARLHLGEYKQVSEFVAEVKLIFDNCVRYWKPDPQGQTYCESAKTLTTLLKNQVGQVFGSALSDELFSKEKHKSSSSSGTSSSKSHRSSSSTPAAPLSSQAPRVEERSKKKSSKPSARDSGSFAEKEVCLGIVKQLRAHKMKGYRGVDILTAGPFLHAVDTTKYPDYLKIIPEPMDFAKIERKLKGDRYVSASEFSADVHLIFSNCHKYNSDPVEGADIRAMASGLRDYFVELYNEKLNHLDGNAVVAKAAEVKSTVAEPSQALPPPAPLKVDASAETKLRSVPTQDAVSISELKKGKAPSRSPTKKSASESALSTSVSVRDPEKKQQGASTSASSTGRGIKQETSVPTPTVLKDVKVKDVALPPLKSASSAVSSNQVKPDVAIAASNESIPKSLSSLEADELKRKKRERKEKRDRKKEKKEKKKKRDKKKEKKDKKEKSSDRSADAATKVGEGGATLTTAKKSADASAPVAPKVAGTTTTVAKPVPLPAPAKSSVGSKLSAAELQKASASSSSSRKSKKSKKSDLNSWESSCERVLNRLTKIEQVAKLHFDQPLLAIFPQLSTEYSRLIAEPMDLRTLREQLHAHALTVKEFLRKGRLIFQNAVKFNCANDPASLHVREMSTHLLWYFDSLCAELNLWESDGDNAKQKKALRQERAELVKTVPMDIKPKECLKLLRVLNSQKYDKNCWPFRKPVQVLFPTLATEYFDIIKAPMDLATISEKVAAFEYKLHGEFIRDVRLTFENAILYNKADKDREGWSVYAAAIHMLGVVEDLWGDVTLEVTERLRRKEKLRKERERLGEKKKPSEKRLEKERKRAEGESKKSSSGATSDPASSVRLHLKSDKDRTAHAQPASGAVSSSSAPSSSDAVLAAAAVMTATSASGSAASRDGSPDVSSTRVKLSIVNRQNVDRMNKSERKAEEKRRKRARREEEIARSEKRRRTAVAATDDALREAEVRSRRKLQKLEIAQAMKLREERDRKTKEADAERALSMKMKFDASAWTGVLMPAKETSQGFWSKKRLKLQLPSAFQAVAAPIGSH